MVSDNVAAAELDLFKQADNFGSTVKLQYEYTPVPEPRQFAVILGLLLLSGVICLRRRRS